MLKDIIVRHNIIKGNRVHFVPGWDCHGMPIEQKAFAHVKTDYSKMSPQNIRQTGRKLYVLPCKNTRNEEILFQRNNLPKRRSNRRCRRSSDGESWQIGTRVITRSINPSKLVKLNCSTSYSKR